MTKKAHDLLNDYHLLSFDALDSTNEEAKRLARAGGKHGAVIWAKKQSAGRGRHGREWVSEEGNLFVTFLLSPGCDLAHAPQLSFVAALAAADAVAPLLPANSAPACKWPNDILVGGKKLGGILLESFQHEGTLWVAVGIGINIDSRPEATQFPATCLQERGVEIISAKIVLSRLIHHFVEWYNTWEQKGFAPVRRAWTKQAWKLGEPLLVRLPNEEVQGVFKEIDLDGALVLQTGPRKKRIIHAGDVFPLDKQHAEAAV